MREPEYHSLAVAEVVVETHDAKSFVLEIPSALGRTFGYSAGQFCAFRAHIDGEPVVRCYSMSSSPDTGDRFAVTVKRVSGGKMSNWMNDALFAGDAIDVMPPSGRFVLRANEAPLVAFAGGSGITPILSLIKSALVTSGREIALVYANRDARSVLFARELERLREASGGRLSIHHHLDDAERAFLDAAACAALVGDRAYADFYVCGPGPYMEVVEAGLAIRGVDPRQLFIERFELPGEEVAGEPSNTESVVVRIDRRRHRIAYKPGDTILETARRAGLAPPFSCESGSCATCMAHVDEGRARMRVNNALSDEEVAAGWVLTCQAIPLSREVVVDYDR
ncbi:MAG TPA: ferredoxin--NADP reductase [Myxococcota bacterium]|nr:ferredoxin--NADP reductase [Myxococcota bacterium]